MFKKETLLRDCYRVNENEYFRLLREEDRVMLDFEAWKIFDTWVGINKKLNDLFVNDPFIHRLLAGPAFQNLIKDKNEYGFIGELDSFSFDHTSTMQLRWDVCKVECADTVTGIITFPYFHTWQEIKDWISKVPEDNYSVYIINPILSYYGGGTVGLFLTPNYFNGYVIEQCNRYIIGLTGFPLFLTFSDEDKVEEIKYVDLKLSKENFIGEVYERSGQNIGLLKVLNFWKDHDEIRLPYFEEIYRFYMDVQPYNILLDSINFVEINSKKPFELIHEDTKKVLGKFKQFSLDRAFKVIDTESGEFKLSDDELKDLLDGKYDFVI